MGHCDERPEIQWKSEATCAGPVHAEVLRGPESAGGEDAAELRRAEQEKEKRVREALAEELDIHGNGKDRKDMLQKWVQRLRRKVPLCQNVFIDNGETQPGREAHIKGCRAEDVRQAVSKARYHMKARQDAVEDRCMPESTQARCLCRLDGPQEMRSGYHGIMGATEAAPRTPCWG